MTKAKKSLNSLRNRNLLPTHLQIFKREYFFNWNIADEYIENHFRENLSINFVSLRLQ